MKRDISFLPIFSVATVLALEEAIESQLDEVVVGNVFDDVTFGAINLVQPYMTIVNFVSYLICVGGAALIVRAHGSDDKKTMDDILSHSISCCLFVGLLFFGIYMSFSDFFVELVAGGTVQFEGAKTVFFWQCFYAMVFPLCVFLQTYVLYMGGYLWCAIVTLSCMILNPFLSVIMGRAMGVGGIMLATVIINILEILFMSLFFIKRPAGEFKLYIDIKLLKRIFALGLGESSIFLAVAFMEFVVNAVAVNRYGTTGIVVIAIVINLVELVIYVSEGISEYETVALNEYIGSQNDPMIHKAMETSMLASLFESVIFIVVFLFASQSLVNVFDVDDARAAEVAITCIRFVAAAPLAVCFTRISAIFYQYTERIRHTVMMILISWGLAPAVFSFIGGDFSINGIVWGIVAGLYVVPIFMTLTGNPLPFEKDRVL